MVAVVEGIGSERPVDFGNMDQVGCSEVFLALAIGYAGDWVEVMCLDNADHIDIDHYVVVDCQ